MFINKNDKNKFNLTDELIFNELRSRSVHSSKLIGEVTLTGYDKRGNVMFIETEYNDVMIPGAVHTLKNMFGISPATEDPAKSKEFRHPENNYVITSGGIALSRSAPASITSSAKIFGFMIGIGGEDSTSIVAPNIKMNTLSTYIPFQTVASSGSYETDSIELPNTGPELYRVNVASSGSYKSSFVKEFMSTPTIHTREVGSSEDIGNHTMLMATSSPVVNYAEVVMYINQFDARSYFGGSTGAYINQIGLIAGQPYVTTVGDVNVTEYWNLKLVTCLNFKAKEFGNDENTLKITYRVYCV